MPQGHIGGGGGGGGGSSCDTGVPILRTYWIVLSMCHGHVIVFTCRAGMTSHLFLQVVEQIIYCM